EGFREPLQFPTYVAQSQPASRNIVETAVAAGTFKTLVKAVEAAGLVQTLSGPGPFTVFAPTDEAFAKLPPGTLDTLLRDRQKLSAILTYHVVAGRVLAADVTKMSSARTVNGQAITITVKDGTVMVDNARVIRTDILASNGVIHVIDTVILPK
ncbi:MAG: fasciclin domain-containing protein, partial [Armatimonadota bacterium]|nr:fasciclin domain-containing protein [Armatimonadota bacterium]